MDELSESRRRILAVIKEQCAASIPNLARARSVTQAAAREIYAAGDEYTSVEQRGSDYVVIEKNCPYLDVAIERPAVCSTTVSALRRLTGHEVVRERRFQDGDGRCEFHVSGSRRGRNTRFEIEPPRSDQKP